MIVVAIIAIIAAIAIPNLLAARLASNETSAVATLRSICSAQAQFQLSGKVDVNGDGTGEYGLFREMSGAIGARQDVLFGDDSICVHRADAATSSRANFGAALKSELFELQFVQHRVQISPSPIGELPVTYVGHSPIRHIVVHESYVYIDQGVCAPKPKRADPTLPTVLDHRQFAYWLNGVATVRVGAGAASQPAHPIDIASRPPALPS